MSSNDKTRQKLMESMRRTKAGTEKKSVADKEEVKNKVKTGKPVKGKSKKAQKKVAEKVDSGTNTDPYQSGRRIWPD